MKKKYKWISVSLAGLLLIGNIQLGSESYGKNSLQLSEIVKAQSIEEQQEQQGQEQQEQQQQEQQQQEQQQQEDIYMQPHHEDMAQEIIPNDSVYMNEQFCQTYGLEHAGSFEESIAAFPESYKTKLRILHEQHPNWVFVPYHTGIDWNTFIKAEMTPKRNLVERWMPDEYKGKQSWAYDPATGTYIGLSGDNWVQASEEAVAYYADPRNFLNQESIFQFDLLSYNGEYQTEAGVEAIISGTFMSNTVMPDDVVTYARAFCMVGQATNTSPYMLAARVYQEQGSKGNSPLISGTYPGYEGYYNFFNIKAAGATREEIYINGLKHAKSQDWNSRYRSIMGGGLFLSGNYISIGQDTLYLQKFDLISGKFSHQYMQNLLAPSSEAAKNYKAYTNLNIVDQAYVFKIPIYQNMPVLASPKPGTTAYDEEKLKAFITRLYTNILGRPADEEGMNFWIERIAVHGDTGAELVKFFVLGGELDKKKISDEEFMDRMYMTIMNRKADSAGKAYWCDIMKSGCSRRFVAANFVLSQEFAKLCVDYGIAQGRITLKENRDKYSEATLFMYRLYQYGLNRQPDIEGLNYWSGAIGTKKISCYQAACAILDSAEFRQKNYSDEEFLTVCYQVFFDRKADSAGIAYWQKQLSAGVTRNEVVKHFAYSNEFKTIVSRLMGQS